MQRREVIKKIWQLNRVAPVAVVLLIGALLTVWGTNELVMKPKTQALEGRLEQRRRRHPEAGMPMQGHLKRGAEDVEVFWGRLPQRRDFPELLSELMNLAMEAGLGLERVQYRPDESSQEGLLHYSLAFAVKGDYARVKKFIHLLERSSRLLIIDQVSLSGKSSSGGVLLNIGISTYFKG